MLTTAQVSFLDEYRIRAEKAAKDSLETSIAVWKIKGCQGDEPVKVTGAFFLVRYNVYLTTVELNGYKYNPGSGEIIMETIFFPAVTLPIKLKELRRYRKGNLLINYLKQR